MEDDLGSDYSTLDSNRLESLIRRLKNDQGYRSEIEDNRLRSFSGWIVKGWVFFAQNIHQLDCLDENGGQQSTMCDLVTVWCRLTRDLVSGSRLLQDGCLGSVEHILKLLWFTSAIVRLDHPHFKDLNRFGVQCLSNLITLNPAAMAHNWKLMILCEEGQSVTLRMLYTRENRLLLAIAVLMLNSIGEELGRAQSLFQSVIGKKTMTMLLERMDDLLDHDSDAVFEVIVSLVRQVIKLDPPRNIPELYESQATPSQKLSPAQLSILKILESTSVPPINFLLKNFKLLCKAPLEDCWKGLVLIAEMMEKWIENTEDESTPINISDSDCCTIVKNSIEILEKMTITDSTKKIDGEKRRSITQIKTVLVKLLSGFCHLNGSRIQDYIREIGGIKLILGFTQFDVDQPFLREHSLFLIRNLLFKNPKNQELIEKMDPVVVTRDQ